MLDLELEEVDEEDLVVEGHHDLVEADLQLLYF